MGTRGLNRDKPLFTAITATVYSEMNWSYSLLFLLALSLEGLAVLPQVREKRQQSTECQDGLLRIQQDCNGLRLTDVDAEENVDAALKAACTSELCQEAVTNTLTVCTGPMNLDTVSKEECV